MTDAHALCKKLVIAQVVVRKHGRALRWACPQPHQVDDYVKPLRIIL